MESKLSITVTVEVAVSPHEKPTKQSCKNCHGMGWVPSNTNADTDPCHVCWGDGFK